MKLRALRLPFAHHRTFWDRFKQSFEQHPYWYAAGVLLLYLVTFQFTFVTTGDAWAEAFYEYVHGAMANGWQGFFHTGIAGYYNFLPKLFSYPLVLLNFPVGYIDYFFRFAVIAYTIGCIAYIAHSSNRYLIKNDYLRLLLALMTLMSYYHISSFSFINVWYVGFIPMILISLNPRKFDHEWQQLLYAGFAMSICLTKPSVIVLPLVVYRMIRHREWLLGAIITFAIGLESLLFFTSEFYVRFSSIIAQHVGLPVRIMNVMLYVGLLFLKLFQAYVTHLWLIAGAFLAVLGLIVVVIMARGVLQAALLALTGFIAAYTALYSPDTPPVDVNKLYELLLHDQMKLQREVMISFFLLLFLFITLQYLRDHIKLLPKRPHLKTTLAAGVLLLLTGLEYRPLQALDARNYINIDAFRADLTAHRANCMPIPPTPSWLSYDYQSGPTYPWYYENGAYGSCDKQNYDKSINYHSFSSRIGSGRDITIENTTTKPITSLMVAVSNPNPHQTRSLALENIDTHQTYEATIKAKPNNDRLSYLAFNLRTEPQAATYRYILKEAGTRDSGLTTGSFTDGGVVYFPYFVTK